MYIYYNSRYIFYGICFTYLFFVHIAHFLLFKKITFLTTITNTHLEVGNLIK